MTEETEVPDEQSQGPICPHCLAEPLIPEAIPFNSANGFTHLVYFCAKCRKALGCVILSPPQPRSIQNNIIMPGRPQ